MPAGTQITLCIGAGSLASAAEVTFVMNNGDRHRGQLFYDTGTNVGVVANGQKRTYPVHDIAVILYAAGDPSRDESRRGTQTRPARQAAAGCVVAPDPCS
jgi:hypothetical protein